ncbi:MAG: excinuclease ABC subunit UvrA [Ruminococcaceae bacterium]|nr:excinuclease ABC subunit UvrA [Oscillospiraceae bacterium]
MIKDKIVLKGARENNLKNINVEIPRNQLVVFTGLSGSGKSSLAFDTLYAEAYRRFVESLSSYARQFLGQLDKPDVDFIDGLSPAISIDQKTTSKNPRSTVGTVTEIYDYLRLLFASIGVPHCPICGKEISKQSIDQIIEKILSYPEGVRFQILSPIVRGKKGLHEKIFSDAIKSGYARVRVDGFVYSLSDNIELDKNKKHNIEIVIDRLVMKKEDIRARLTDSVETALSLSNGLVMIEFVDKEENASDRIISFSENFACEEHGISLGEILPRLFSFNNPFGACPHCAGLGTKKTLAEEKIIADKNLSLAEGAIQVNGFKSLDKDGWTTRIFKKVGEAHGFDLDTPIKDFSADAFNAMMYGTGDEIYVVQYTKEGRKKNYEVTFEGVVNIILRRVEEGGGDYYDEFFYEVDCPECSGKRLKKEALSITVGGKNIAEVCDLSISDSLSFFKNLTLSEKEKVISKEIIKEIITRLDFLKSVGLEYLSLSRKSATLSGGESQRIRLATQIGSSLVGVMYILDEPSIGLHQRDNGKLIATLKKLRDVGNTVIVVEHDEETIEASDFVVDIGPAAGVHGGEIIFAGPPSELKKCTNSATGRFLSGVEKIHIPEVRRLGNGNKLRIKGAAENNLKSVDVEIPLGTFTCVTGVSGSGKSSLVNEILYKTLARDLNRASLIPGKSNGIDGIEHLDKVIDIDQSPIGRTPRSNPATYTGVFNHIRALFASTKDAKERGFGQDRFSFNLKGGRCEACEGDGTTKIEMHFLSDVYVTCDVCGGKRYNRETLEVKYKGKSIADVLDMTVEEANTFFENVPQIKKKIQTLCDVGLGYIKLGQSSTTLSGGEAQRVKLATELSKPGTGNTMYVLDEPTTGLHSADVKMLVEVLQRLVDAGNTVVVIEHNLDLIKTADYIIDMGPEGGDKGGEVIATGTPEHVSSVNESFTGEYLRKIFEKETKNDT